MEKVYVITDTNSGLSPEEAEKLGIGLVKMTFTIDGVDHTEFVDLSYEDFFKRLEAGADVSTSQPSPLVLEEMWNEVLEKYDSIVHIPMSSALSSSYETANALAQQYDGRVQVVNNRRISITQMQSVIDALRLAEYGMSAKEIKTVLEREADEQSIYITVNTLELLKKSGRVTKAAAALATVLGLKPVLQIQGGKLDAFKKARGMDNAKKQMINALKNDMETRFKGKKYVLALAYSGAEAPALQWKKEFEAVMPGYDVKMYRLPISICCHTGDGAMACGMMKVL